MKEEAGAWYVPPINPMATKHGTICQKASVRLTAMPVKDMLNNPSTIMRRGLNRSAKMAMARYPIGNNSDQNLPEATAARESTPLCIRDG
jgi:hypothetical protein